MESQIRDKGEGLVPKYLSDSRKVSQGPHFISECSRNNRIRRTRCIDQRSKVKDVTLGDIWSGNQQVSCWDGGMTGDWKGKLWWIGFHLCFGTLSISNQTKLPSVESPSKRACLSTVKSSRSRPRSSHADVLSRALPLSSSLLTFCWASATQTHSLHIRPRTCSRREKSEGRLDEKQFSQILKLNQRAGIYFIYLLR